MKIFNSLLLWLCLISTAPACCCCCGCRPTVKPNEPTQILPAPAEVRDGWKLKFYVFRSNEDRKWYWSVKSRNGRITGDGGEGYESKQGALHGIQLLKDNAKNAEIVFDEK